MRQIELSNSDPAICRSLAASRWAGLLAILALTTGSALAERPDETPPPATEDRASGTTHRITNLLAAYHATGRFDGAVLVAASGRVVFQGGFGLANHEWSIENASDTGYAVGSIGKLFTALVVLRLEQEEKLSLRDSIGKYLPDYPSTPAREITVRQLLTHTSGLPDYFDRDFFTNHMFRPYSREEFLPRFCSPEPTEVDGPQGIYSNTNYCILGMIIERVTGKSFERALQEHLIGPLNLERTGLHVNSRVIPELASGYLRRVSRYQRGPWENVDLHAFGPGSMISTIGDLFELDRALYESDLFPDTLRKHLYTEAASSNLRNGQFFAPGGTIEDRVLVPDGPEKRVHQAGGNTIAGFNALMTRVLDDQHTVILLANSGPGFFDETLHEITDQVLQVLYGGQHTRPKQRAEVRLYEILETVGAANLAEKLEGLEQSGDVETTQRGLYSLGTELLREGRVDDAMPVFQLIVSRYPQSGWSYVGLAEAREAAGDQPAAIESIRRAIEISPRNPRAVEILERLTQSE